MRKRGLLATILLSLFLISACTSQVSCNKPYILVGSSCCLDQNDNSICDNDEQKPTGNNKPLLMLTVYGEFSPPNYSPTDFAFIGQVSNAGTVAAEDVLVGCNYFDKDYIFGHQILLGTIAPGENKQFEEPINTGTYPHENRRTVVDCEIDFCSNCG